MLYALKLRSVGRDGRKLRSLGGVAGTVFLKSKEAAARQYEAMGCRGFSGEYRVSARALPVLPSILVGAADLAVVAAYIFFGRGR